MFEPWQLGLIDEAGYNGIRPEHIRRVGDELNKLPYDNLDEQDFRSACRRACIDPNNFTQSDIESLQDFLRASCQRQARRTEIGHETAEVFS